MTGAGRGTCDHLGFFTNDADRLVDFYRDAFGFAVEKEDILPSSVVRQIFGISASCRFIKLAAGGHFLSPVKLELFQPLARKLGRRRNGLVGCNHWGLRVGDRMEFVRAFRKQGISVIEARRGKHSVYFVRDPDGNRIELRD